MGLTLSVKVNNVSVGDFTSFVKISDEFPTINWELDLAERAVVNSESGVISDAGEYHQAGYDIRISTSLYSIGTDLFIGNKIHSGYMSSQELFWTYSGPALERNIRYYGQVLIRDDADRTSDWRTFSFFYNSLPDIANLAITPSTPSVTDDLVLSYDFTDMDGDTESGTIIRWFKNDVYQRQFNDATTIKSYFLQNGDIWTADVYPSDGYEYGVRQTSSRVRVTKTAITVSNLKILPKNPNPNDILKAEYVASDETEQGNVSIRWYVNDSLLSSLNDLKYVRPALEADDEIRIEVRHVDSGSYVSSSTVTIVASDFVVNNITIDGKTNPLDVSSITPLVKWGTYTPDGKQINYVSIKIGTFYGSSNVYSTTISYERDSLTIPPNLLDRGRDYYLSIAVSNTQTFDKYSFANFRVFGSRWNESVSNATGWTMETLMVVRSDSDALNKYQVIKINDGSKFAEIRLYSDKIRLISGSQIEYLVSLKGSSNILTIAGKKDDIKIYLNRELVIDGEGVFSQISNVSKLEVGASSSSEFVVSYKYLFYTTSGYFLPGISSGYANLQFHEYMEFEDNEIVGLQKYKDGKYVFGLNPDNDNESSTIYAIKGGDVKSSATVPRTFSPINKINKSPNGKISVFSHGKGVSIITGYLISSYDNESIFVDSNGNINSVSLEDNGWEIVENFDFDTTYLNEDGFNIYTLGT